MDTQKFEDYIRNQVQGPWQRWLNQIGALPGIQKLVAKKRKASASDATTVIKSYNTKGNIILDSHRYEIELHTGIFFFYVSTDGVELEFDYLDFSGIDTTDMCLLDEYEKTWMAHILASQSY